MNMHKCSHTQSKVILCAVQEFTCSYKWWYVYCSRLTQTACLWPCTCVDLNVTWLVHVKLHMIFLWRYILLNLHSHIPVPESVQAMSQGVLTVCFRFLLAQATYTVADFRNVQFLTKLQFLPRHKKQWLTVKFWSIFVSRGKILCDIVPKVASFH